MSDVASPARRTRNLLAIAFLAAAISLAEYARCFPGLGPRWTLLAFAAFLTGCALGAGRGVGWTRVVGGVASVVAGVLAFALALGATGQYVTALDLVLPGLALAAGACALSTAAKRAFEHDARANSAAS